MGKITICFLATSNINLSFEIIYVKYIENKVGMERPEETHGLDGRVKLILINIF